MKEYANGIRAFFALLRRSKLSEIRRLAEQAKVLGLWQVRKFSESGQLLEIGKPFSNILVNVGMEEIWKLVTAQGGTAFSNANARLGVGDSSAAPAVGQTDLQAAVNKFRKAMDGGFPNAPVAGQEQWRSTFAGGDANFDWREFAVFNAAAAGTMMNRSVSSQGTKASGQTWQLTYTITLS